MRVLVVEDEVTLAETIRRGLVRYGFAADVATDGDQGLWMASEVQYDVVVLDIMLPGRNGYQVCAALRAAEVWTPILVLTAKDGEFDHAEALDTGADDFLTKPFSFVVLVAHLRALIRRGSHPRPVVLRTGDLELDPSTRRCRRGDVDIELTPRQFSLLEFLMRRAGDAVSKTEIAENVWDEAFDGDLNIVEVYVGNLRRRVDAPFDRRSIETVRGAGYRLDPDGG